MASAVDDADAVVIRYFLHEANAARAENARFGVECHARPEFDVLGFLDFLIEQTRLRIAVLDGEFLQLALAGLIANGAVERVINEEKLHHALAGLFDHGRTRSNRHSFRDVLGARDLRPWNPPDLRLAIRANDWLPVRTHLGHAHFNEAHATITRRRKLRMIAIMRNELLGLPAGFNDASTFGKLQPDAVDLDVEHLNFGRGAHE